MIEFFEENFELLKVIAEFVLCVLLFVFRGKSLSKSDKEKLFKEIEDMKYRLPSYQEKNPEEPQTFTNLKAEYVFNPTDNTLIVGEEPIDLQALVNSSADCSLDRILERFGVAEAMRLGQEANERVAALSEQRDDLVELADIMFELENAREQFGLPLDASMEDIAREIKCRNDALTLEIDRTKKLAEQAKEANSGTQTSQNQQTQSTQDVSQNGEQSTSQES